MFSSDFVFDFFKFLDLIPEAFRSFRKYLGVSPKEYLTNYRLNIAASLLSTGTAVKEVALACGYMDIYSFSKAFKKRFGCSPSTYAQKADKDGEDGGAALPAAEEGGESDGT